MEVDIDRLVDAMSGDKGFACPYCGFWHDISDGEICQAVTSYWGDDPHPFSCSDCGADFIVEERVTRHYEASIPETES